MSGNVSAYTEIDTLFAHGITFVTVKTLVMDQTVDEKQHKMADFLRNVLGLTAEDLRDYADELEG